MSGAFIELVGPAQVGRVTLAFEQAIAASFAADRSRMTQNELRRRFDICRRILEALRGELGWSLDRVLDTLPHYLRCELDGAVWGPRRAFGVGSARHRAATTGDSGGGDTVETMTTLDRMTEAIERVLKGPGAEAALRALTESQQRLASACERIRTAGAVPTDLAGEIRLIAGLVAGVPERYPAAAGGAMKRMRPEDVVTHAFSELQKAAAEPPEEAQRRLAGLAQTVAAAKQAYVDESSEQIDVPVYQEETTAQAERSEKETSPVALEAGLGNSAFAANAEDLRKRLARLRKEIDALAPPSSKETPAASSVTKREDATWPADLNTPEFRQGVKKADSAPDWGYDIGGTGGAPAK